ncbi:MAG: DUF1318 domain-containing protein [Planctomycetes bacterium]|nr:DUF1318 domain-containing protein [Planctomycetota bacterium]
MDPRTRRRLPFLALCCFTASCAQLTININFSPAEIQKAAEKIESEIRQGQPAPPQPEKPQSFHRRYYFLPSFDLQEAFAEASVDLNVSTPGIRKKVESRKARYTELKPYLDSGALGEGKDGLIVLRALQGVSGAEKVKVNRLVQAENQDRQELFEEVAKANNIDRGNLGRVIRPFAEAIRGQMEKGQWYQEEDGSWKQR